MTTKTENNNDEINPLDLLEGEVALLLEKHGIGALLCVTAKLYGDIFHERECPGCFNKAQWLQGKLMALEAEINMFGSFPEVGESDCEPAGGEKK